MIEIRFNIQRWGYGIGFIVYFMALYSSHPDIYISCYLPVTVKLSSQLRLEGFSFV